MARKCAESQSHIQVGYSDDQLISTEGFFLAPLRLCEQFSAWSDDACIHEVAGSTGEICKWRAKAPSRKYGNLLQ